MNYKQLGTEVGELVDEKNAAYGNSFEKCAEHLKMLYPNGIRPDQYGDALALVRIFDKEMRIATRKDAFGESPYRDIAGYGLLGAMKDETGTSQATYLQEDIEQLKSTLSPNGTKLLDEAHAKLRDRRL